MTLVLLLTALALPAQDAAQATACDSTAIRWHLPGTFAEARERARSEGRMLLVKGISFGIDAEGAVCATKGRW